MPLIEETLFGRVDKVQKAIDRLKSFVPPEGYYTAFSGGKDSQCVYHLCKMAGVKFDAHYSVTGVDPPKLVLFIKRNYPDVKFEYNYWNDGKPEHYFPNGKPKQITMWSLIADHTIPPTRQARYCCSSLKETGGVEEWSSRASAGPRVRTAKNFMAWPTSRPIPKNCTSRRRKTRLIA